MAVSKIWKVTVRLAQVIDYALNPEKTAADNYTPEQYQALADVLQYAKDEEKTEREFPSFSFIKYKIMKIKEIGYAVLCEKMLASFSERRLSGNPYSHGDGPGGTGRDAGEGCPASG